MKLRMKKMVNISIALLIALVMALGFIPMGINALMYDEALDDSALAICRKDTYVATGISHYEEVELPVVDAPDNEVELPIVDTPDDEVELPVVDIPVVELPEYENTYTPDYENDYDDSSPEEENTNEYEFNCDYSDYECTFEYNYDDDTSEYKCTCECEYDYCDYECDCDCDRECAFEAYYIEIMPLSTVNVNDHQGLVDAIADPLVTNIVVDVPITMTAAITIPAGRDITITGATLTRSAGNNTRHFTLDGTLQLENITLYGDSANTGTALRGGITINGSGHLIMHAGSRITGNRGSSGGAVLVNGGTFTMHNGSIDGNSSGTCAGGVAVHGGTFTMHNGDIHNNSSTNSGGMCVHSNSGFFTMISGSIRNNTSSVGGGGIHIHGGGTVTMQGGEITTNTATNNGGGVRVSNGTFTMQSGIINNNTTALNGGGISVEGGSTTLNGGTISGNTANGSATANGGGGLNWNNATNLNNLTIAPAFVFSDNTAATGLRIDDQMNIDHNIDANGRINPSTWTAMSGVADNNHAFNNLDIRTTTGVTVVLHTVTFNLHGGDGNFPPQQVQDSNTLTAPTTNPTRANYNFTGWYTAETGGAPFDFDTPITANTVLHARWTPMPQQVTVTFNLHGGTGNFPAQQVQYNNTLVAPTTNPTRANYNFTGWYTAATGGAPFNFNDPIMADTVIHARWTPIPRQVTVTFNLHGGSGNFPAQQVQYNNTLVAPTTNPTRANYNFVGWFTAETGGAPFNFNNPILEDTVIHARWEPAPAVLASPQTGDDRTTTLFAIMFGAGLILIATPIVLAFRRKRAKNK